MFVHISNNTTLTLNSAISLNGTSTTAHTTFTVDAGSTVTAGANLITCNSTTPTCLINGKIQTAATAGFNGGAATCITSTNTPTITLGTASTIEYNSTSTQTITARTDYANLTANSSTKMLVGATTAAAAFTHTNGVVNLNGQTLALNGTQIFPASPATGSFTGSTASNLIISGTAITNPLFFTSGAQTLNNFTLSSSAAQTLALGTPLTISGAFTHTSAIINLNGNALTLNGAITFPTAVTNGSFTGSSTSVLNIGGTAAITNSMFMTQTNSSTNAMQDITLNRTGRTLTLGNPLNLIGTLTPMLGTFASAGNLTLIASSPTVTCSNATTTFTLQSLSPSFIQSTTSASANNASTITFNNTSINATSYLWNFGDGTTSASTNAIHQYTSAGNYDVTLTAYNQTCGDSAIYSQVITIDSSSTTTGIKSFTSKENNMQIDKDATGYFVQFNYTDKANAIISVQNLLGEKVSDDIQQGNVSNNKIYVSLGNSANNVLIISVVTSAGEKIFRKVINY